MTAEERARTAYKKWIDTPGLRPHMIELLTEVIKSAEAAAAREALERAAKRLEGPCQECANELRALLPRDEKDEGNNS